jgi:hypothetical protein
MDRQTFETFMASLGASPQDYREAFAAARRSGHPVLNDYLEPRTPGTGALTYSTAHLTMFWDDQSQAHLVDVVVRWLETPDSFGAAAKKWDVLRRRLNYPAKLADLVEKFSNPTGRVNTVDARLENALARLRSTQAHEGAEFVAGVIRKLYASPIIRNLVR